MLAKYWDGTTWFAHHDHLGSTRALTAVDGSFITTYDYLPFGETENDISGTSHKFTHSAGSGQAGLERDVESALDHTWFRQYASSLGRWTSPDPVPGWISNPQSLNRYAYVLNLPTNLIDPLGLQGEQIFSAPEIAGLGCAFLYSTWGENVVNLPGCGAFSRFVAESQYEQGISRDFLARYINNQRLTLGRRNAC